MLSAVGRRRSGMPRILTPFPCGHEVDADADCICERLSTASLSLPNKWKQVGGEILRIGTRMLAIYIIEKKTTQEIRGMCNVCVVRMLTLIQIRTMMYRRYLEASITPCPCLSPSFVTCSTGIHLLNSLHILLEVEGKSL